MRKNQSSITATGIAFMRAVESDKPSDERICYDPYARQLVPSWMYHVLGFFIKSGYAEMRGPGVNGFLAVRERCIDDVLQKFIDEGLKQLVILGAGFDSRAYRFNFPTNEKIFEVDHPATQADKLKKLQKIFGKIPEQVTFVPIDFNTQTLSDRLLSSGYNPGLKTLFIWQGVTMYLTSEAVDDTLSFVVKSSAPGSAIIFDYVYHEALEGIQKKSEIRSMRRYRFMTGESLTFGIHKGTVETFLKTRGFREVKNYTSNELKTTYFTGKNSTRKVTDAYGIVIGKV